MGESGLTIEIVGLTSVAGLISSEVLKDPTKGEKEIPADEAFEFFDVDGNGYIQRGDLEYVNCSFQMYLNFFIGYFST